MKKTRPLFRPVMFLGAALIGGFLMADGASAQGTIKKGNSTGALSFAGNYTVKGMNPDGSEYSGTARVGKDAAGQCQISWTFDGSVTSGLCMDMEDLLTAAYTVDGVTTIAAFARTDKGGIEGVWVANGVEGMGYEELVRQ